MNSPKLLSETEVNQWLGANPSWHLQNGALVKGFEFGSYDAALGFVVRVACAAEKRDHHPDILFTWGKVQLSWATHSAGGLTLLDTQLAEISDSLHPK